MSDEHYWSPEGAKERAALRYRCEMRRTSHKRWQRPREWDGGWQNPVPEGAPVSIWKNHPRNESWTFRRHADRVDWTQVRAYRLEHGTPYPQAISLPKTIPPELAGTLHPLLQFRFDHIDEALARIETMLKAA